MKPTVKTKRGKVVSVKAWAVMWIVRWRGKKSVEFGPFFWKKPTRKEFRLWRDDNLIPITITYTPSQRTK